jgi:glycosyltransferase involved in cell wall biosynthesis
MKVLALTIGDVNVASTHYRIAQFIEPMRREGVELFICEAKAFRDFQGLPQYDLVIVQKRLMRSSWMRRVRAGAKRMCFDTDDAIWEAHDQPHSWWTRRRNAHRLRAMMQLVDCCTVANEELAKHLRPLSRRVHVVPMALDSKYWAPRGEQDESRPVCIGWAGAPVNLPYLLQLEDALRRLKATRPEVEIVIYSGQKPEWASPLEFRHVPYKPGRDPQVIRDFDIGLLPLPDNPFSAGKSPIKAIQYAASGIPCLATPVGATREIVIDQETGMYARNPEEWFAGLLALVDNPMLRESMGLNARRRFERHHALDLITPELLALWRQI